MKPGMVLVEDVRGRNGVLLVARDHTISSGLLERLLVMGVAENVRVALPLALGKG